MQLQRSAKNQHSLQLNPLEEIPFKFRCQTYHAKSRGIKLL